MKLDRSSAPTLDARGLRVALVAARFNDVIVGEILASARAAWARLQGDDAALTVHHVPGAFELPFACRKLALAGDCDAIVALGCIIRGDTPHFDYVAGECARGLMQVGLETPVPVIFGVLTVNTVAQAEERADPARLDKGREFIEAAIEMARFSLRGMT
jgi:6,7-dimethyl-8-ribityllumazine synthase